MCSAPATHLVLKVVALGPVHMHIRTLTHVERLNLWVASRRKMQVRSRRGSSSETGAAGEFIAALYTMTARSAHTRPDWLQSSSPAITAASEHSPLVIKLHQAVATLLP